MQRFPALVPELTARDFKKSLKFYTEILGFSVKFERPEDGFAYLTLGSAHLMLEQLLEDSWRTGEFTPPLGRGINLEIAVEEIAPLLKRLESVHCPLWSEPQEQWYRAGTIEIGVREFLVQDPDGYLLRFSQELGERPLTEENHEESAGTKLENEQNAERSQNLG